MNELPENNQTPQVGEEEFSTIFSDPQEKNDKSSAKNVNRGKKVIIALAAVAILVLGTIGVIKLIPVIEDEQSEPQESLMALNVSTADVKTLSLTNNEGAFNFYSLMEETKENDETQSKTTWCVEGIDKTLTSSSKIAEIVSNATNIPAIREITGKTMQDCGLDSPKYTAKLAMNDGKEYKIAVGALSADKLGNYISVDDKIFLCDASVSQGFEFVLLDLANATDIPGIEITSELSEYVSEQDETRLESFDSLTISGANFSKPMVINMLDAQDGDITYSNYVLSSHGSRAADNTTVATLFGFFVDRVSLTGAYSFENTEAARKAVGLDKPYVTATLKVGNVIKTFKISKVDENNCAIVSDDSPMIYKTSHSSIEFLEYKEQDFFGKMVYIEYLKDVAELKISDASEGYSFGVSYDEKSEERFVVTYNGKRVESEKFQDFYEDLVGLEYADFEHQKGSSTPEITIVVKLCDGTIDTFNLYKDSSTRYACELNGKVMGRVSSTQANQLLKIARTLAQNAK